MSAASFIFPCQVVVGRRGQEGFATVRACKAIAFVFRKACSRAARIEHVEIDLADLNQGFEKFAEHLKQNGLSWPQLLASAFTAGKTRIMMTYDLESLDTLLRTLERSKDSAQTA